MFLGLVEQNYIFLHTDSAFVFLKQFTFYADIRNSIVFTFIGSHIPTIIILSIGFIIYKMLFSDIMTALIVSLIGSLKKQKAAQGISHHANSHNDQDEEEHDHEQKHETQHEEIEGTHG